MYRLNYISCTGENDTTVFDNLTTTFDTRQVTITKSNCEHIKASDDTSGLQSSQMFYNITVTINEDVVQNLQKLKDFARDNNIDLFDSQDKKVDTSPEPTIAESTSSAQTTTSSETHPVSNAPHPTYYQTKQSTMHPLIRKLNMTRQNLTSCIKS